MDNLLNNMVCPEQSASCVQYSVEINSTMNILCCLLNTLRTRFQFGNICLQISSHMLLINRIFHQHNFIEATMYSLGRVTDTCVNAQWITGLLTLPECPVLP